MTIYPTTDPTVQATENNFNNDFMQSQAILNNVQERQQHITAELARLGSVSATVAFNIGIPLVMEQEGAMQTQMNVGYNASLNNEQNDIETMVNLSNQDTAYCESNAQSYNDAIADQNSQNPQNPNDQTIINNYNTTYNQGIQAQQSINNLCVENSNSNSQYYNCLSPDYATTMQTSEASYYQAMTGMSSGSYGTPEENFANNVISWEGTPGNTDTDNGPTSTYTGPASSPYSADMTNLTSSLDTESNATNSISSQLQGEIKVGLQEGQQYQASAEQGGKAIMEGKNYAIQLTKSSG